MVTSIIGNIRGPQGLPGDQGPEGPQGIPGEQGNPGSPGQRGADGAQGIQGEKGSTGTAGQRGADGAQGIQGEKGSPGADGRPGADGPQGVKGDTGANGTQGAKGNKGDTGSQGIQGIKGDTGQQGAPGPVGRIWRGTWDPAIDYAKDDEVGYDGASWYAKADPVVGDVPSSSSTSWDLLAQRGAKGDKGDTGSQGIQGIKGDTGTKGTDGAAGTQGIQGIQGVKGDTGAKGADGAAGSQGIQGVKGDTGAKGTDGAAGTQGIQGVKGDTGTKGDTGLQGTQGIQGVKGDTGSQGIQGVKGDTGPASTVAGPTGPGVPDSGAGGTALFKVTGANQDTGWKAISTSDVSGFDTRAAQLKTGTPSPGDFGLAAWSFDPAGATAPAALTPGRGQFTFLPIRKAMRVLRVYAYVGAAGVGVPVAGMALYDLAGNLLANCSNVTGSSYQTIGLLSGIPDAALDLPAGGIYVANWVTASTTLPKMSNLAIGGNASQLYGFVGSTVPNTLYRSGITPSNASANWQGQAPPATVNLTTLSALSPMILTGLESTV